MFKLLKKNMRFTFASLIILGILSLSYCDQNNSDTADSNTKNSNTAYIQKGKTIASATFATLSGNLQKAMKEGGVPNAIKYCNLNASPLVDSLSQVYKAEIRRTSLKVRNPKNKPTTKELQQLEKYQKSMEAGEALKPLVQEIIPGTIAFYAPIHVMPLCEKCHGKAGETLKEEDYQVIQQHYPEDKATGYASGDLRGMWSISFKK